MVSMQLSLHEPLFANSLIKGYFLPVFAIELSVLEQIEALLFVEHLA
jgi:hypothetical protein